MASWKTKRRLAALIGSAIVLATAVEILLRLATPFRFEPRLYPGDRSATSNSNDDNTIDTDLGWHCAPNSTLHDKSKDFDVSYQCNEMGFRSHGHPSSGRTTRVLTVGDSFTFGVGVGDDETFAAQLERGNPGMIVENCGMPGYGTDQMLCVIKKQVNAIQPNIVIVTFVKDDMNRSMTSYRQRPAWTLKPTFVLQDGELVARNAENSPNYILRWLAQHLYTADCTRRISDHIGLKYGCGERFELNISLFRQMDRECRKAGAKLLVVYLPEKGGWAPQPAIDAALGELSVPCADLGASPVSNPRALYFGSDPHINQSGHKFVAEQLGMRLRTEGWIR